MQKKSNGGLPPDEQKADAEATARAARSLRRFSAKRLSVRYADADEARDPLELRGFGTIPDNIDIAPVTCHLGFACQKRSDECDVCEANEEGEEQTVISVVDADDEVRRLIDYDYITEIAPLNQTRHDAWIELWKISPTSRGARVIVELRRAGRMNT